MEQYAIGGPDTVRGFPQSEVFGDSGCRVSAELKATLFEWRKNLLQGVAFVDHGAAALKDPPTGHDARESLSGGGIGLRLSLGQWGLARFDLGFPMDPSENSEDKSPILYSQVSLHF
jgi:hemolysin activation/secretion protein